MKRRSHDGVHRLLGEGDERVDWIADVSYVFGGAFQVNAVPHFVSGVTGRPFQSPFAKPAGEGLSSARVNVLWGALNFAIAYVLIYRVGTFVLRSTEHAVLLGIGATIMGHILARSFGRFHGGNIPERASDTSV